MSAKILPGDGAEEFWFEEGCHIAEISNHPDDPQVSIARARVGAGNSTRWHCLHKVWERYIIVQGEGIAEIGELPPTRVAAGSIVLIPPGARQRIHNTGGSELIFYAVCSPRFTRSCYQSLDG